MLTGHRDRVGPGAPPSVDWGWPNAGGGGEIPPTGGTRWHEVALPGRVSGSERPWPPPPNRGPVVTAAALPFSPVSFRDEHLPSEEEKGIFTSWVLPGRWESDLK